MTESFDIYVKVPYGVLRLQDLEKFALKTAKGGKV
jgi:hypothetical protein